MKVNDIIAYNINEEEFNKLNINDIYETDKIIGIIKNKKIFDKSISNKYMIHVLIKNIKYTGKLIEFEGIDCCGKTTQIELLKEYLIKNNKKVKVYDFPNYGSNIGKIIGKYLRGDYGDINSIPADVLYILFAADRVTVQQELNQYLNDGYYVLLNRYTYSNLYQLVKNNSEDINFLEELEFNNLNIIKPDIIIYFNMKIEEIKNRMLKRGKKEFQENKEDIHENNNDLLINVDKLYKKIAKEKNWVVIDIDNNDSKEQILEKIIKRIF